MHDGLAQGHGFDNRTLENHLLVNLLAEIALELISLAFVARA